MLGTQPEGGGHAAGSKERLERVREDLRLRQAREAAIRCVKRVLVGQFNP